MISKSYGFAIIIKYGLAINRIQLKKQKKKKNYQDYHHHDVKKEVK